jgi:2-hydroxychromene-2-carboxylate isomerase
MADIEFFFDCSSPWTYLAFHNIGPLATELGATITWRPILVGGIFNAVNPSVYASREHPVPLKQAYAHKDMQDWARLAGIKITFPPKIFPVNSVKAMRGCLLLAPEGKLVAFARAAFEAYFGNDEDISQDDVLRRICAGLAIEPESFFAGIATPAIKDRLKANTDEVIRRGGFGSPTIFVGGGDMYFGNDRLPLVREALVRRRRAARERASALDPVQS